MSYLMTIIKYLIPLITLLRVFVTTQRLPLAKVTRCFHFHGVQNKAPSPHKQTNTHPKTQQRKEETRVSFL